MHQPPLELLNWAQQVQRGELSWNDFAERVTQSAAAPVTDLDLQRRDRCGFAEVVYGPGKPIEVLLQIVRDLRQAQQPVLVTRIDDAQREALAREFPQAVIHEAARTFRWNESVVNDGDDTQTLEPVAVVSAGTGDLPIALEAVETLKWMGVPVRELYDVGVAGPHRLVEKVHLLRGCAAVIVVAGMEGALPSVVGGHVDCPVIGVPTSVGYGANLGGWSAMLSMLNSCAANVSVVNIDAGFKGGYLAGMIAHRTRRTRAVAAR